MIITEQFIRDNLKTLGDKPPSLSSLSSFNRRHHNNNEENNQDHPQLYHSHHHHFVPKELNLSFQGLEQIENFMNGFGRITTLLLNNNKIQEICSLEDLICLEKLDLSFNEIRAITGLDSLINLTHLSLFHNKIAKIEGLSRCTNLQSISLGANAISSLTSTNCGILNLKDLKYLKDCNLAGNPITSEEEYRQNVLSDLPQLEYLDNVRVVKSDEHINFQTATTKANNELDITANADVASVQNNKCAKIVIHDELPMIVSQLQSNLDDHHEEFMNKEEEFKNAIQDICHDLNQIHDEISLLMSSDGDGNGDVGIIIQKIKFQCDVVGHEHMDNIEQMLYNAVNHRDIIVSRGSEKRPSDEGGAVAAPATVTDRMMKAELQVPTIVDAILANGTKRIKKILLKTFALEDGEEKSLSHRVENIRRKCREVQDLIKIIQEEESTRTSAVDDGYDGGELVDLTYYATLEERVNEALQRMKDTIENKTNSDIQTLREEVLRRHRQRVGEIAGISLP